MIAVIDLYRIADEHVPVNAGLLYIICDEYKDQEVMFCAEETHCSKIESYWQNNNISVDNITWKKIKFRIAAKEGIKLVVQRIRSELKHLIALLHNKNFHPDKIFFLSLSPFTSFVFKRFLVKNTYTLITLHGDVEFVRMSNSFARNMLGRFFRRSFKLKKPNCQYLALNKVVKQNLVAEGYLNDNEVIAVYHPYIFRKNIPANDYEQPLTFAHIGIASIEKQAHYLYDIAEYFKQSICQKKMKLEIIGRNENIELKGNWRLIDGIQNKHMLERSDFESKLEKIHYAVFFYSETYQLTGSGALMDALDFEKPVIALRNQLFETFFADAGNIGYLCNSVDEMKKVIEAILTGDISESDYTSMQLNIRNFKTNFSLLTIKEQLFGQINRTQLNVA